MRIQSNNLRPRAFFFIPYVYEEKNNFGKNQDSRCFLMYTMAKFKVVIFFYLNACVLAHFIIFQLRSYKQIFYSPKTVSKAALRLEGVITKVVSSVL